MVEVLEKGNLFVLYRPKVDSGADSVQRLYLLLASESRFRLFIVGANALPADESRSEPDARHWALVRAVSDDAGEIASILRGGEYETETEGTRHLPPAAPVGEGRYALAKFDDDAQLVFELDRFEEGGLTREIRLERKGFLIVAVRNPEVDVEGFPDSEPGYPEGLRRLFRGRRWIGAVHPGLLNHAGAQLALIRGFEVDPSESGLDEVEDRRLEEFVDLDLPRGALDTGEAPDQDEFDRRHHAPLPGGFPEGSRSGGRAAAKSSDAASAISSLLAGLSFPASREEVLEAARDNRDRLDDAGPALERLEALPDGEY
ncbi:MAG: DUF2795 domain-containing protein, partial [Wenzhouxiangellaceae bacterium]|nr:DUF2795 domain-containing protein [Wenzhouxiangellaceae bacterium]